MDVKIINGREIAAKREEKLKKKIAAMGINPKVVSILIGNDAPSILYTNMKQKKAAELGIDFQPMKLPEEIGFTEVQKLIISLNQDPSVNGIMMQLPLPKKFLSSHKTKELINLIKQEKDIDGLRDDSNFQTAAVVAVFAIIEEEQIDVAGKYAVVVGASDLIGKPIAKRLEEMGAMVKLCDSKTEDLSEFTQRADIIISATGAPYLIKGDMVKTGVVVIDVGVMVIEEPSEGDQKPGELDGKVVGDVDFVTVFPKAYKITPVPGGVGPVTVVSLMENVVKAVTSNIVT